jgi:methionyl-tRNA formyltransferase
VHVPHHNGDPSVEVLEQLSPEIIVMGGTRILKARVFETASLGALNAHPGLLPEVRGSASVAWSIHRDVPIGCTCHFIDAKIDTGPIVGRRTVPVHRGDTYEKLCRATLSLSATLMREALEAHVRGELQGTPQPSGGDTYRNMPPEMVEEVKRKLAEGRYLHFVD